MLSTVRATLNLNLLSQWYEEAETFCRNTPIVVLVEVEIPITKKEYRALCSESGVPANTDSAEMHIFEDSSDEDLFYFQHITKCVCPAMYTNFVVRKWLLKLQ